METIVQVASQDPDVTILSIEGDADDHSRDLHRLEPLLNSVLASKTKYLAVNLSGLVSVGCEALAKLMWAAMLLRADGGDMALTEANAEVGATLKKLGVDRMIDHYPTQDEAVAAVRGRSQG